MCNMVFVGRNEKSEAGIQERHVAMETTAKGEQETQRGITVFVEGDTGFSWALYKEGFIVSFLSSVKTMCPFS